MLFSSRRIRGPRQGMLGMHPLVDVLEGRSFLCATLHDGVVAVEDPTGDAGKPDQLLTQDQETGHPSCFSREEKRNVLLAEDGAPVQVVLPWQQERAVFSRSSIDEGGETLFANLFHDR